MTTKAKRVLRGGTVRYSDGRTIKPSPLNVDRILADLERVNEDARTDFLCTFAHSLTVEIRALLFDRPVSEADLDRVYQINESLHQLTSCANPDNGWSVPDRVALVRSIIHSSHLYGIEGAVGRALAVAAVAIGSSKTDAQKSNPAIKENYAQIVGAYGEKIVEAELLRNGWLPANVNETVKNAAKFDIFAQKGDSVIAVQVKTCGPATDEFSFSRFSSDRKAGANEFTILVKMGSKRHSDHVYVIPTQVLYTDIKQFRDESVKAGIKDIQKWALRLAEQRRPTGNHRQYGYGFAKKWRKWLDNWQQLEAQTAQAATAA